MPLHSEILGCKNLLLSCDKFFYSKKFNVQLSFHKSGVVTGSVVHFYKNHRIVSAFEGVFLKENDRKKLAFMVEWYAPDLMTKVLTAFSSEIIKYSNSSDCLIIKWHHVSEHLLAETGNSTNTEILFDRYNKDFSSESEKIMEHLPESFL